VNYKEAINASQNWAARGYNEQGECEVAVAHYGDNLLWLTGWEGDWQKKWKEIPEDEIHKLEGFDFVPTGPKPEDQISREVLDALTEIADEYELEDELKADYFEPMGELPEPED